MPLPFCKIPSSTQTQLLRLESRGLTVPSYKQASHQIQSIGYHRLRGYAHYFLNATDKHFSCGVTIDDIFACYFFDSQLRSLLMQSIEMIEIAVRSCLANQLAEKYNDAHWFLNPTLFQNREHFTELTKKIENDVNRKRETHVDIKHYYSKYSTPYLPPIWVSIETISFGTLSKLFTNLKTADKREITALFSLPKPIVMESSLYALVHIRNMCAHHVRIWNTNLPISPQIPNYIKKQLKGYDFNNRKVFKNLLIISHYLNIIAPEFNLQQKLHSLIEAYPQVPLDAIGIVDDSNLTVLSNIAK
ncbi:Abi family protein [Candidatus Albibeggiatoa sp. nov. BB20]|uniref:Abi family protein n=1 Tax=Candidatus Albibeggiatoa sp. nov. BB20 TaxID=3162723 RepID=UPI003365A449